MTSEYESVQLHFFDNQRDNPVNGSVELTKTSIKHKSDDNTVEIMLEDLKSQRGIEYTKDVSREDSDSEILESGKGIVIETFGNNSDYILTSETSDMKELQNKISDSHKSVFDDN